MSITSVDTDYDNLTITLIADFDAPVERVWETWSDPGKLERWWGPPTHPATVEKHDLTPGGEVTYVMTGPQGATWGTWRVTAVDPPTSLEFTDAFTDQDGERIAEMPLITVRVRLTGRDGGTGMGAEHRVIEAWSTVKHEQRDRSRPRSATKRRVSPAGTNLPLIHTPTLDRAVLARHMCRARPRTVGRLSVRLGVAQLLIPMLRATLGREVEQVPKRLDRTYVTRILA